MQRLTHDLRVALRGLRRTPLFTAAVLLVLGLGIGAAVATFAAARAMLVRPLPVRAPDGLVVLWPWRDPAAELSPPATVLPDLRRASRATRDVAGVGHFGTPPEPYLDGDRTRVLRLSPVTSNYFGLLGAQPALGRLLHPGDEARGAPRVLVLSYRAWQTQFGADPSVVGRALVDPTGRGESGLGSAARGVRATVVGVAPPGLDYPAGVDAWAPILADEPIRVFAVARLAPGASAAAARAEFAAVVRRLQPELDLRGATVVSFREAVLGDVRPVLRAVSGAVALLLLIACVNVGTLLLVRAGARARELAVRRALGARAADLVRQLVVEHGLLAVGGGALGAACAAVLLRAFVVLAPPELPRLDLVAAQGVPLGLALAVTGAALLLFGVLPALAAARGRDADGPALAAPLRLDARSGEGTRARRRVRDVLVAAQVALALVLLAGAGLLARSVQRLTRLDLGYRAEHLTVAAVAYDAARYDSAGRTERLRAQVLDALRALPGATAATTLETLPFAGANVTLAVLEGEGQTSAEAGTAPAMPLENAGEDYFRTFGIPLLRGRGFAPSDRPGAPPVVVVSEGAARRLWPGRDPLGRRLRFPPAAVPAGAVPPDVRANAVAWRTVVGVVPDTRFRALREPSSTVYFPAAQSPMDWTGHVAVRTRGDASGADAGALRAAMQRAVRDVDPALAVWDVRPMDGWLAAPLATPRLSARLLGAFSAAALALAAVGLFGVTALAVRERTRELGVRAALGATPARLRGAVLRRALGVAAAGAAAGLAATLAGTRVLRALLFEVSPTDPATLGAVCALLLAVVGAAAYVPARRATRVDPTRALRE